MKLLWTIAKTLIIFALIVLFIVLDIKLNLPIAFISGILFTFYFISFYIRLKLEKSK